MCFFCKIAKLVIRGDYGNGQERIDRLGPYYDKIQRIVNNMLERYPSGIIPDDECFDY